MTRHAFVPWVLLIICVVWLSSARAQTPAQPVTPAPASVPVVTGTGPIPPTLPPNFVHPPLKCLARFTSITEFPVVAWCVGGGPNGLGFKYQMAKNANAIGFNTILATPAMISNVSQFDRMMLMIVAIGNTPQELDAKLTGAPADPASKLFGIDRGIANLGLHPRLIGALIVHNATVEKMVPSGKWLHDKYPALLPYVAANGDPGMQRRNAAAFPVLGTQNFSIKTTTDVVTYCSKLNFDRDFSNDANMAFWPMYTAPVSDSKYRFQVFAALAYGAQGLVCFAYVPTDAHPEWQQGGRLFLSAQPVHRYVREVVGKHLWGCRSMEVYQSAQDAVPRGNPTAAPGKVVEQLSRGALVGVLSPEADALAWDHKSAPMYAMVVDKRNVHHLKTRLASPAAAQTLATAMRIVNQERGTALAVATAQDGEHPVLSPVSADPRRQWTLTPKRNLSVLVNKASGFNLAVGGGSKDVGAKLVQTKYNAAKANHHWTVQDLGGGLSELVNSDSGLVLAAGDGNAVEMQTAVDNAPRQQWRIEPSNGATARSGGILIEEPTTDADVPLRDVVVAFSSAIETAEVLGPSEANPGGVRHIEPGCHVTVPLVGGDGRLLQLNPPDLAAILGPALADYQAASANLRQLTSPTARLSAVQVRQLLGEAATLVASADAKVVDGQEAADAHETIRQLKQALAGDTKMIGVK